MDITRDGNVIGSINPLKQGDKAIDFTLTDLDGNEVTLSKINKTVLISVFPDINTPICELQTKRFNEEAGKDPNIEILSISTNTKEDQKNWCAAEGVDMKVLSDDGSFGKSYGLLFEDGPAKGKLARSIFIIKDGEIIYSDINPEIRTHPDYETALKVAKEA